MLDVLRALSPVLLLLALGLSGTRRRLVRQFTEAGAFSEEAAIVPSRIRGLYQWWLKRLAGASVLRRASGDRWWLDRDVFRRYRSIRRRRAFVVFAVLLAVFTLAWGFAAWTRS